ncbi:uncharacterized protein [Haliotis asinina]|uniref:uncharacterized protein n=1 Tax=Haliotis asinina TaxID=109174 RepID=UPI00353250E6
MVLSNEESKAATVSLELFRGKVGVDSQVLQLSSVRVEEELVQASQVFHVQPVGAESVAVGYCWSFPPQPVESTQQAQCPVLELHLDCTSAHELSLKGWYMCDVSSWL